MTFSFCLSEETRVFLRELLLSVSPLRKTSKMVCFFSIFWLISEGEGMLSRASFPPWSWIPVTITQGVASTSICAVCWYASFLAYSLLYLWLLWTPSFLVPFVIPPVSNLSVCQYQLTLIPMESGCHCKHLLQHQYSCPFLLMSYLLHESQILAQSTIHFLSS